MASRNKNKLPQEGTGESGESLTRSVCERFERTNTDPVSPAYLRGTPTAKGNVEGGEEIGSKRVTRRGARKEKLRNATPGASGTDSATASAAESDTSRRMRVASEEEDRRSQQNVVEQIEVVEATTSLRRKRTSSKGGADTESDASSCDMPPPKVTTASRGRSNRPVIVTPSAYLKTARAEAASRRRVEGEQLAEEEVEQIALRLRSTRGLIPTLTAAELRERGKDMETVLNKVATKSKNLKGTFVRIVKEMSTESSLVVEQLSQLTPTEENNRLIESNNRLQKEVTELRAANVQLTVEMALLNSKMTRMEAAMLLAEGSTGQSKAAAPKQAPIKEPTKEEQAIKRIENIMIARLEAIEARLPPEAPLRPLLAADRVRDYPPLTATQTPLPCQGGRVESYATAASGSKTKKVGKKSAPASTLRVSTEIQKTSTPAPIRTAVATAHTAVPEERWQTVGRGKKKKKKKVVAEPAGTTAAAPPMAQTKRGGLKAPKSAAVVITVLPEAAEKGLSYETVMRRARQGIDTESIGGVAARTRKALTGARILEFPGTEGAKTADALAEKLRQLFSPEEGVRVTRPVKCAEMRIAGLDDSVTVDDVRDAIVSRTGCSADSIRVGVIRPGPGGMGAVWVQCPVTSAKILTDAGRLLVGWSSARVSVLEPRPTRCFKCMAVGHTRPTCKNCFDCSGLCFRCGRTGHKAASCSAIPHCSACAAGDKPSNHVMGGKGCQPPASSTRVGVSRSTSTAPLSDTVQPSSVVVLEEELMETAQ